MNKQNRDEIINAIVAASLELAKDSKIPFSKVFSKEAKKRRNETGPIKMWELGKFVKMHGYRLIPCKSGFSVEFIGGDVIFK